MWAGQVSSPVRLESKAKRMAVRRGNEGQGFPCNLCGQWGFGGDFGFSSTTNNSPFFVAVRVILEELFLVQSTGFV